MDFVEFALGTELFRGFSPADVETVLLRLNGVRRNFAKGETVVNAGLPADRMLTLVSGRFRIYEEVRDGRQVLVREMDAGEVLGLWLLHVSEITCWPWTVVAAEPSTALSFSTARARELFAAGGPRVDRLAVNMTGILSRDLLATWRKLGVMNAQTIESRIEVYLSDLDNATGHTGTVKVPFNRERMAEYFGVTRPALSRVLGQMRNKGLLAWRKNLFRLNF